MEHQYGPPPSGLADQTKVEQRNRSILDQTDSLMQTLNHTANSLNELHEKLQPILAKKDVQIVDAEWEIWRATQQAESLARQIDYLKHSLEI